MSDGAIDVHIQNFQGLKDVEMTIDGFTILRGPSEHCKSAVVRAIHYALTNKAGTNFIKHGQDECYVKLDFKEHNFCLEWFKTKKGSKYRFDKDDNKIYEKLNRDLPQPIIDFGFSVINSNNSTLHPQVCSNQHDTLFFLNEKDSSRTDILTEISETTQISKARKLVSKDLKSSKVILKNKQSELDSKLEVLDKISEYNLDELNSSSKEYLDSYEGSLNSYEESIEHFNSYNRSLNSLNTLSSLKLDEVRLDDLEGNIKEVLQDVSSFSNYEINLNKLQSLKNLENFNEVDVDIDEDFLKSLMSSFSLYSDWFDRNELLKKLSCVDNIDISEDFELEPLEDLHSSLKLYLRYKDTSTSLESLEGLSDYEEEVDFENDIDNLLKSLSSYSSYVETQNNLRNVSEELLEIEKNIEATSLELSEFNSCPLCNSELSHERCSDG